MERGEQNIPIQNLKEIAFALHAEVSEDKQGLGIITKACRTLLDFAFSNLHLEKVNILCATENAKSRAIPTRLNFKEDKIEECIDEKNVPYSRITYVIDSATWEMKKKLAIKEEKLASKLTLGFISCDSRSATTFLLDNLNKFIIFVMKGSGLLLPT